MKKFLLMSTTVLILLSSCVSKKKYTEALDNYDILEGKYEQLLAKLSDCESRETSLNKELQELKLQLGTAQGETTALEKSIAMLEAELEENKLTQQQLLTTLSDLSVVSKEGAANIQRSMKLLEERNAYIKDLNGNLRAKDSLNLALVTSLKRSLSDISDSDVNVSVKKGVVYISISDKLLFNSGSSRVNQSAEVVLGKVAKVLNDHNTLDILVEGHTDDKKISTSCVKDNWDLSADRAISVVRVLQDKFNVAPQRMTAGGRSFYMPKGDNATPEGRAMNRRTEIIVLPKLDEFFNLLSTGNARK